MRKIFLLVTVLNALFFSACRKEESDITPLAQAPAKADVGVVDGRLVFKDVQSFENHVQKLNGAPKDLSESSYLNQVEQSLGFTSVRALASDKSAAPNGRVLADEGIVDDHLASMLDAFNRVQIGKWIFKLNLKEDKCYVLDEKNASPSLLKEMESQNPSGSQFMVYNTHEDVLDLLAAGKPSAYKAGKTTGIFGNEDKRWYNLGNGIHFDAKVVYQAAAFYFSLQAKGICLSEGGFLGTYTRFPVTVNLDYYFRFDPKGSGERTGQGVRSEGETGETSYRPYEGSRGLEKYQYDVTFSINYPNLQFTSEDMGIYRGY